MEKCYRCETAENLLIHERKKRKTTGDYNIRHICRACNTARAKAYRATKKGKERVYQAVYRSVKKNKKHQNARTLLNYHVRVGNVEKPKKCERCEKPERLHGHHEDYSKPLDVMWLCTPCHWDRHAELKEMGVVV